MTSDARRAEELRIRYLTEAIETASPAVRLTMLFDSLEQDLARADRGFADGADLKTLSDLLIHSQEILALLRDTLDVSAWEPAARIRALYDHLYNELVMANLEKDRARTAGVAGHVAQLAAAWREAAAAADSGTELAAVAAAG